MTMNAQRGFSLVELLVTIVLAMLVTGAAISMFVGVHTAQRATSGAGASTDSGRFALNTLEQAVRASGNMGCSSTLSVASQVANTASQMSTDYIEALGGYEAVGTSPGQAYTLTAPPVSTDPSANDWISTAVLGGQLDNLLQSLVIKGTDVLVVRGTVSGSTPTYLTAPAAAGTSTLTIADATGFSAGIGVLTNCISSVALGLATPSAAVGPATVSINTPLSNPGTLSLAFDIGSQLALVGTNVYFIGKGADGDGALFMAQVQPNGTLTAPQELVPDIENMQVLYGIDTTGNHNASQYVTADQVGLATLGGFNGVVSVRIAVLASSQASSVTPPTAAQTYNLLGTTITAPADSRVRRVFDTTVSVRNTGI